jgi:hypothetical protein
MTRVVGRDSFVQEGEQEAELRYIYPRHPFVLYIMRPRAESSSIYLSILDSVCGSAPDNPPTGWNFMNAR